MALGLLGAAALLGVVLAGYYLAERPIRGAARLGSVAHGVLAALGVVVAVTVQRTGLQGGTQGLGETALVALVLALLGGMVIVASHWRRRRPPGVVVAVHATIGIAGIVMLVAVG